MPKIHPADERAKKYLSLQKNAAENHKKSDIFLIIFVALAIVLISLFVWLLPQESFSENENRMLTTARDIDLLGDISSGRLGERLAELYSDQFPLRSSLIAARAEMELSLGKLESGGVMISKNRLIPRLEYSEREKKTVSENLAVIEKFRQQTESEVIFAVAPRAVDVLSDKAPELFSPERSASAWELFFDTEHIRLAEDLDPEMWFSTDHHWTARGAYEAYLELAEKLGFEPLALEKFKEETVSEHFYGTAWSKSGAYWVAPDELRIFRHENDGNFKIKDPESGKSLLSGLYDEKKLETKDKYGVFLGGDYGHIEISSEEEKPRLLVIKDSYFNALAPFLAQNFTLDVIDLRYFSGSVSKYVSEAEYGKILILCGLDSLATAKTFTRLFY